MYTRAAGYDPFAAETIIDLPKISSVTFLHPGIFILTFNIAALLLSNGFFGHLGALLANFANFDDKFLGADPDNRVLGLLWDLCARADLATTNKTA
jgi:hypothetical protein